MTNVGGLGSGAIFLMWSVAALLSAGTIPRVRWLASAYAVSCCTVMKLHTERVAYL